MEETDHDEGIDRAESSPNQARCRSNKDLTENERMEKRKLKNELKARKRRKKLQVRLQHAINRKDGKVEAETRKELEEMGVAAQEDSVTTKEEKSCRTMTAHVFSEVLKLCHGEKTQHKEKALSLLRHMTKGTQTPSMFQNISALWGYTKQKFHQRAVLVFCSFAKLRGPQHRNDKELRDGLWRQLMSVKVICSVGSGPGCDAVGAAIFMDNYGDHRIQKALLVDFAMDQWRKVIDNVEPVVVPSLIGKIITATCDITDGLQSEMNRNFDTLVDTEAVDLYLFSYILSETRGKWLPFVSALIDKSRPGALFYFSEPKPWQLHIIMKEFVTLEFVWLDSSMDEPEMQPLDNRLGPGVLLGRKQ